MLRHLFSHVRSEPWPEEPEIEPSDPNTDRALSDSFRSARRSLVAFCAVCVAWSTAQFTLEELNFDAVGMTIDLKNGSIPLMLGAGLGYLIFRWAMEFAMMPRHVRRWRLAQVDFRLVCEVARFSTLAIAAGALNRSLRSIGVVILLLLGLALVTGILTVAFTFVTMPIRMWARERAKAVSAANAAYEAFAWATLFAISLTMVGTIALGVASYRYDPLRTFIWPIPPHPVALSTFLVVLNASFLSFWILPALLVRLFSERPPYRTERTAEGNLQVRFVEQKKEPLL